MKRKQGKKDGQQWLQIVLFIVAALMFFIIVYVMVPPVQNRVRGIFSKNEDAVDEERYSAETGNPKTGTTDANESFENDKEVPAQSKSEDDYVFWDPAIRAIAEEATDDQVFLEMLPDNTSYHDTMVGLNYLADKRWTDSRMTRNARNRSYQKQIEKISETNDNSCTILGICYTMRNIYEIEELSEIGISLEDTRYAGTEFDYDMSQYTFIVAEMSVENVSGKTKKDINCNPFSYLLLSEDYIDYTTELLYGSYQPGKGTHKYFAVELAEGERVETTAVFMVPTDSEFDRYQAFVQVTTVDMGSTLYGLIPASLSR